MEKIVLKVISVLSSVILSFSAFANGAVCQSHWGGMTCGQGKVADIYSQGIVSVIGTEVEGRTKVQGTFSASQAKFNSMRIQGSTSIADSVVNGDAEFFGSVDVRKSNFYKLMTVHTENMKLDSCQVPKIVVDSNNRIISVVKLRGNTKVGEIVFNQPGNEVWLFDNASIDKPVVGGKVINKKS
jgi:hypothetical protein